MRFMVKAGTVKVGDEIQGRVVTGLGQSWIVDDEDNSAYGAQPGEAVRVQYAYCDPVAATAVPVTPTVPAGPASAPAYGSREWKVARVEQLAGLIEHYEAKAQAGARSARFIEQQLGQEAAEKIPGLRAELERLGGELAQESGEQGATDAAVDAPQVEQDPNEPIEFVVAMPSEVLNATYWVFKALPGEAISFYCARTGQPTTVRCLRRHEARIREVLAEHPNTPAPAPPERRCRHCHTTAPEDFRTGQPKGRTVCDMCGGHGE